MAMIKKTNNTIIIIVSKWDDICNEIRLVNLATNREIVFGEKRANRCTVLNGRQV